MFTFYMITATNLTTDNGNALDNQSKGKALLPSFISLAKFHKINNRAECEIPLSCIPYS
uniref:Uncharacterized protein n=1 Tax=Rhizophora mucronata TaxID=61149 RepID=A0A2P2QPF9_RHIMU